MKSFEEMKLVRTCPTRWGNQFLQLERNDVLKLTIDQSLQEYKKANKGLKEAIVVANDSDQGSKVSKAVAATDIGLNNEQWDANLQLEAFLKYPYEIKETIEHKRYCTGAQGLVLFFDIKENFCSPAATLTIKEFPKSLSVKDRDSRSEVTMRISRT